MLSGLSVSCDRSGGDLTSPSRATECRHGCTSRALYGHGGWGIWRIILKNYRLTYCLKNRNNRREQPLAILS